MTLSYRFGALALVALTACDTQSSTLGAPDLASLSKGSGGGSSGGGSSAFFFNTASLIGTQLTIDGVGATPGATMKVNGVAMGSANASGSFSITNASYASTTCSATVSDGKISTVAQFSPCSPGGANPASVPKPLLPASGASVLQPVGLSWSTATAGTPVVAYNWELATSSAFTQRVLQGSTNAPTTTSTFSGLPSGTYWWRVQEVELGTPIGGEITGAWSTPVSFTITGSVPGTPAAPTIAFPVTGAQYHPYEMFYPRWNSVPNAASYVVEYSLDANFTPGSSQITPKNTAFTTDSMIFGNPITLYGRVRGVSSTGVLGVPSAPIKVLITYTAPIGPAPVIVSPVNGAPMGNPLTLVWLDVQNPQLDGYRLEVANEPTFKGDCAGVEYCSLTVSGTSFTFTPNIGLSLAPGTHYWRVQSEQGDSSPLAPALTAWSKTGSFVVP